MQWTRPWLQIFIRRRYRPPLFKDQDTHTQFVFVGKFSKSWQNYRTSASPSVSPGLYFGRAKKPLFSCKDLPPKKLSYFLVYSNAPHCLSKHKTLSCYSNPSKLNRVFCELMADLDTWHVLLDENSMSVFFGWDTFCRYENTLSLSCQSFLRCFSSPLTIHVCVWRQNILWNWRKTRALISVQAAPS